MSDADDEAIEAARQRRIADACLVEGASAEGRVGIYRRLVRANLETVTRRLLPRTAAALDAQSEGGFMRWLGRFLAEASPRTPYVRDVPRELVTWAVRVWAADADVPAFASDLARHEADRFEVESAPSAPAGPPVGDVAPGRPLVFATPRKLARYDHDVLDPSATLPRRPTCVLLHRDDEATVHATPVAVERALLLTLLLAGETLAGAASRAGVDLEDAGGAGLRDLAGWLAELGAAGALLGGAG